MDEVIIGAPYVVDKGLLVGQNISVVFHGTEYDVPVSRSLQKLDPYLVPKDQGIYCELESPSKITTTEIINRILANKQAFIERNKKKQEKEIREIANQN